jgi:hypothetical protein
MPAFVEPSWVKNARQTIGTGVEPVYPMKTVHGGNQVPDTEANPIGYRYDNGQSQYVNFDAQGNQTFTQDRNNNDLLKVLANNKETSQQPSQSSSANNTESNLDTLINSINKNTSDVDSEIRMDIPVVQDNVVNSSNQTPNPNPNSNVNYAMDNTGMGMGMGMGMGNMSNMGMGSSGNVNSSSWFSKKPKDDREESLINAENEHLADTAKNLSKQTTEINSEISVVTKKVLDLKIQLIKADNTTKPILEKEISELTNKNLALKKQLSDVNSEIVNVNNKIKANRKTLQNRKSYYQRGVESMGYKGNKIAEDNDDGPRIGATPVSSEPEPPVSTLPINNNVSVSPISTPPISNVTNVSTTPTTRLDDAVSANRISDDAPKSPSMFSRMGKMGKNMFSRKVGGRIKSNNHKKTQKM